LNEKDIPHIDRKEMTMLDKKQIQIVPDLAKFFKIGGLQWTR